MKKLSILAVCLLLAISFTACGEKKEAAPAASSAPATSQPQAQSENKDASSNSSEAKPSENQQSGEAQSTGTTQGTPLSKEESTQLKEFLDEYNAEQDPDRKKELLTKIQPLLERASAAAEGK